MKGVAIPKDKVWYSVSDLAERFGKSADAVERLLKKGDLLAKKIGGTWRVHADALRAYEADGVPQPPKGWETFTPAAEICRCRRRRPIASRVKGL